MKILKINYNNNMHNINNKYKIIDNKNEIIYNKKISKLTEEINIKINNYKFKEQIDTISNFNDLIETF